MYQLLHKGWAGVVSDKFAFIEPHKADPPTRGVRKSRYFIIPAALFLVLPLLRRESLGLTCLDGNTLLTQFSYSPTLTSNRGEMTPTLLIRPISW